MNRQVFSAAVARATFGLAMLCAATLCAAGCSRLSGDPDAREDDAPSAEMERLLDDAPASLKAKRERSADNRDRDTTGAVSDVATSDASKSNANESDANQRDRSRDGRSDAERSARAAAKSSATPQQARRKPPPRQNVDDIPDAAEIGL